MSVVVDPADTPLGEGAGAQEQLNTKEDERKSLQEMTSSTKLQPNKSAKTRDLEAQLQREQDASCKVQRELAKVKAHNGQISFQLKKEEEENTRLKDQLKEERSACSKVRQELTKVKELNAKITLKLQEKKDEIEKLQSEVKALAQEVESLKLETCKGQECPTEHLEIMKSDLLHIIGGGIQHGETQDRVTFTDVMLQSLDEQKKILAQLGHLTEQHQSEKDKQQQLVAEQDQLLHEFETLTSDLDGPLGLLENTLDNGDAKFEAKKLLCALFQEAYDRSKDTVIHIISSELESLFEVQKTKTEEMEDASRGYGLLLHAFSLRMKEIRAQYSEAIKAEMLHKFSSCDETFLKVKATLESSPQDHLGKTIELAWKFVTLPNPLIVCQPKKYDSRIHSPEHGYWDSKQKHESNLVYTRPVVYRNYEGVLACQGWVADKVTGKQYSQQSESTCFLS